MKYIQLTQKETKELRKKYWIKQGKKCAILRQKISFEDCVIDHKHRKKSEKIGVDGKGLCRGVLHYQANSLEGVILNKYIRYGLHKFISLPDFLRNLAHYLENPIIPQKYIYYKEKPKPKKLGKRDYNRIKKYYFKLYPKRRKIPVYPKSGKMTKKWEKLLKEINELYLKGGK